MKLLNVLAKDLALYCISRGFRLPQVPLERINELTFLRDLLAQLQIDLVLDVGANRGQFAGELRRIGYSGLIVSFEPVNTEFRVMQERFQRDPRWRGHQIALGSRDESRAMRIPIRTTLSSFLEPIDTTENYRTEAVEIRRLDGLLPSVLPEFSKSRVFLKMDTQGYDLEVFKGASGCLDRIRGIQSELSVQPIYRNMPHYLEALGVYEAAGFELFNLSVVNRTNSGGLLELNCFMRRPS